MKKMSPQAELPSSYHGYWVTFKKSSVTNSRKVLSQISTNAVIHQTVFHLDHYFLNRLSSTHKILMISPQVGLYNFIITHMYSIFLNSDRYILNVLAILNVPNKKVCSEYVENTTLLGNIWNIQSMTFGTSDTFTNSAFVGHCKLPSLGNFLYISCNKTRVAGLKRH